MNPKIMAEIMETVYDNLGDHAAGDAPGIRQVVGEFLAASILQGYVLVRVGTVPPWMHHVEVDANEDVDLYVLDTVTGQLRNRSKLYVLKEEGE